MCLVFVILFGSCSTLVGNGNGDDRPRAVALTNAGRIWVENTLKSLTLEEKVGQMLQVRYYLDYTSFDSREYKLIREELQRYDHAIFLRHVSISQSAGSCR
jgi:hypothetical protein